MKTKILLILLAAIAITFVLVIARPSVKLVNNPKVFCVAPYDWGVCQDFTSKGMVLTWGDEDKNFINILKIEDWHMIQKGSVYNRRVQKTLMIQTSLLSEMQLGDCGGWGGICLKYSDHTDTFKP